VLAVSNLALCFPTIIGSLLPTKFGCKLPTLTIAVFAAGIIIKNSLLVAIIPLLVFTAHGWRNNSMMAYAEKHVYDETEKD